jgi:hypothetical protein
LSSLPKNLQCAAGNALVLKNVVLWSLVNMHVKEIRLLHATILKNGILLELPKLELEANVVTIRLFSVPDAVDFYKKFTLEKRDLVGLFTVKELVQCK